MGAGVSTLGLRTSVGAATSGTALEGAITPFARPLVIAPGADCWLGRPKAPRLFLAGKSFCGGPEK